MTTIRSLQTDDDRDETWQGSVIRQQQQIQAIIDLHLFLERLGVLSVEEGLQEIERLYEHEFNTLFGE